MPKKITVAKDRRRERLHELLGNKEHLVKFEELLSILVNLLNQDDLLSKKELCQYVGCSTDFVENEVNAGRLRSVNLSGTIVRFRRRDIEAWIEARLC